PLPPLRSLRLPRNPFTPPLGMGCFAQTINDRRARCARRPATASAHAKWAPAHPRARSAPLSEPAFSAWHGVLRSEMANRKGAEVQGEPAAADPCVFPPLR